MIAAWEQIGAPILASLAVCVLTGMVTFLVTWGRVRAHSEQQAKSIDLLFDKVNAHGEDLREVRTDVKWLKSFLQQNGNPKGGT